MQQFRLFTSSWSNVRGHTRFQYIMLMAAAIIITMSTNALQSRVVRTVRPLFTFTVSQSVRTCHEVSTLLLHGYSNHYSMWGLSQFVWKLVQTWQYLPSDSRTIFIIYIRTLSYDTVVQNCLGVDLLPVSREISAPMRKSPLAKGAIFSCKQSMRNSPPAVYSRPPSVRKSPLHCLAVRNLPLRRRFIERGRFFHVVNKTLLSCE